MNDSEQIVKDLLASAGITVNGSKPWDIQIHKTGAYDRFILERSIGFGESYMDGWWDAEQLDETMARIGRAHVEDKLKTNFHLFLYLFKRRIMDTASKKRAFIVGQIHYDRGNELYEAMLDKDMNYSCGYWKGFGNPQTSWQNPKHLEKAQQAKLDLICRKLYLKKGEHVLDIGCGWGNFAKYAATHYGVKVVGVTVSKEQAKLAKRRCKGLPVTIRIQDYRDLGTEHFDKIVSIGMFEHVTYRHYPTFMQVAQKSLKKNGLFLLHTIGANTSRIANDPWNEKYIFPNSHVPSLTQICKAVENVFVIEDFHNFGVDYYPTLMSWFQNFNKHWKELAADYPGKYNQRFYRMWKFYLLASAGAFKSRSLQLWHIVFSKSNSLERYVPVR